jgi:hypothetical protein
MAAVTVLVIAVIFITGAITGSVALVCLASHREDRRARLNRRARLSRRAPDRTTMAGRFLTSLYVRRPEDDERHDYPADDRAELLDQERRDCQA